MSYDASQILDDYRRVRSMSGLSMIKARSDFLNKYSATGLDFDAKRRMKNLSAPAQFTESKSLNKSALFQFDIGNGKKMIIPNGELTNEVRLSGLFEDSIGIQAYATPAIIQGDDYANPLLKGRGTDKLSDISISSSQIAGLKKQGSPSSQPLQDRMNSTSPSESVKTAPRIETPIAQPEVQNPTSLPARVSSGTPITTQSRSRTSSRGPNLPVVAGESAPSTMLRKNSRPSDYDGTTIDVEGHDVGAPPPASGDALPGPKGNGKHGRLDDINDHIEKKYNAAIYKAFKNGGDVDKVDKAATTAAESFRYNRFANVARGLKDKFAEEEAARFAEARKAGTTFKKRNYLDYASEHRNELMGDSSIGAQKQFGGMLDKMIDRRDKLQAEVDKLKGQLNESPAVKKSYIDNANLTKMQKLKINAGSAAGIAKTAAAHPMKFAKALRGDEQAGDYLMNKLGSYKTRADAMASAYRTQNGSRKYEKEHSRMDDIRRARLTEKEQQLAKFNNLDGSAAVFSSANDFAARRRAGERMIGRKGGASAAEAAGKAAGHGWKRKAGAAGAVLALGAVLGTMMGHHGEQSNAQLYNPNPQPQYAN